MKNIPNVMKFGSQSRSSSLIKNAIFEIADLVKLRQIWSQNCNVPDFYKSDNKKIEHANYEYINWN